MRVIALTARISGWARVVAISAAGMCMATAAAGEDVKKVPYWASISVDEARMRVGPSLDYPSNWIYRRRDLPVKVVQTLGNWRKVEDSEGAQGWMHVRLLSDTQTAIIIGQLSDLREAPSDQSAVKFRAEPGVVGRLSDCGDGWCKFDAHGQRGFVRVGSLWGGVK